MTGYRNRNVISYPAVPHLATGVRCCTSHQFIRSTAQVSVLNILDIMLFLTIDITVVVLINTKKKKQPPPKYYSLQRDLKNVIERHHCVK